MSPTCPHTFFKLKGVSQNSPPSRKDGTKSLFSHKSLWCSHPQSLWLGTHKSLRSGLLRIRKNKGSCFPTQPHPNLFIPSTGGDPVRHTEATILLQQGSPGKPRAQVTPHASEEFAQFTPLPPQPVATSPFRFPLEHCVPLVFNLVKSHKLCSGSKASGIHAADTSVSRSTDSFWRQWAGSPWMRAERFWQTHSTYLKFRVLVSFSKWRR